MKFAHEISVQDGSYAFPNELVRFRAGLAWGAKGPGPGRLGSGLGGPFSKSTIFNCFQFKKSEDHLIYDCIFTVFLNFPPNRFCLNPEPRELVWKSV